MALKPYRLKLKKGKKKKRVGSMIGNGLTAIIGVALVSQTANAVRSI